MSSPRKMTKVVATVAFGDSGTTGSYKITECNGFVHNMIINVPDFANNVTATVTILDDDGDTLYTSSALTKNTTTSLGGIAAAELGDVPLSYNYTCRITLSGDAGAGGGTVTVKMYAKSEGGTSAIYQKAG